MAQENTIPGLTIPEQTLYNALLKLKEASARDISKATGFHRTNIYDVMEKLKEKGLVTFYKQGQTTYFQAADPLNLYNYMDEQRTVLDQTMPMLQRMYKEKPLETSIEVFKGKQGVISAYKDIIREKKPVFAFSISRRMKEKLPIYREQFVNEVARLKIPYKLIYTRRVSPLPKPMQMKFTDEEFVSPIEVHIYGNKTLQIIWEPDMMAILIKSKGLAEMYRKHFASLWKQAHY